jgi:hypothetical protein
MNSNNCLCCLGSSYSCFLAVTSDTADGREISIRECNSCGFAWQYPVETDPVASELFFRKAYAEGATDPNSYFNPGRRASIATLQTRFLLDRLGPANGRKLLDVGGGDGTFGRIAAAHGWDVTVVDPAATPSTNPRMNLQVINGTLADVNASLFSVVTLWDVIEHLPNPREILEKALCLLSQDGALVIETGNYESIDRFLLPKSHWIYQLDHRWYFSPRNLPKLLEQLDRGLSVSVHDETLRPGWVGPASYAGPSRLQFAKTLLRRPIQFKSEIESFMALRRASKIPDSRLGIFTMVATKATG